MEFLLMNFERYLSIFPVASKKEKKMNIVTDGLHSVCNWTYFMELISNFQTDASVICFFIS